jgi:hypothetical protein
MHLSTDQLIFWQHGFLKLNATIVYTWGLMLVLAVGAKLITRRAHYGNIHFAVEMRRGNHRHRHQEPYRKSFPLLEKLFRTWRM